jgi:hypothetical protein
VCAPGQTARAVVTSGRTRINGPLYGAGEKDGDARVTLGQRGNRQKKDTEQKKQQQWKNKPFHLNLL